MKRYLLILLTILMTNATVAQNRWAIVVGISDYPTESGWGKINGANDLDLIVPMLQRNGFQATHIKTLTNKQATKNNIRTALIQVCKNLRKGDVVYFHFSGHGQLITDTNGDDCDRGWDQSLIPYDAKRKYDSDRYRGEKHIVDDELNEWLHLLRNKIGKNGKLIAVLDACHSGGGSRDEAEDGIIFRGVADRFVLSKPIGAQNVTPKGIEWVCISACKWVQSNEEYLGFGRLSYALSKIFDPSLTIGQLRTAIEEQYIKMPKMGRLPQEPIVEYNCSDAETIM